MKVKEAMTQHAVTVSPDERVGHVAKLIASHHIGGAFVVEDGKVVGEISRRDVFQHIFPTHQEFYDDLVHNIDFEEIQHRARDLAGMRARDIMAPVVMTVKPDMHVMKVAAWMQLKDVGRVAVIDSDGDFCGVVTRSDIFDRAISSEIAMT